MSLGTIKAADLYVRGLGAGRADAIMAANDGDRIIKPKTSNVPHLENLIINKSLLRFPRSISAITIYNVVVL